MLRKIVGWVLVGLGAFLLVVAVLAKTYASGALMKTPTNMEVVTHLEGSGEKLDPESGEVEPIDVKVTSLTQTDSERSDDDYVVWASTTCVIKDEGDPPACLDGDDPRVVSITVDVFRTNRVTAEADGDRTGLQNKWPFNTEKKDYKYWDGLLGEALDAKFIGEETIEGVDTYHFQVTAEDRETEVASDIDGIYTTEKNMWIEPLTGSIINQTQHERRTLPEGDVLIDLDVAFTEDQVKSNAEDAKKNVSGLKLLTGTVPLVGFIGGPILLIIGLLLVRRKKQTA